MISNSNSGVKLNEEKPFFMEKELAQKRNDQWALSMF